MSDQYQIRRDNETRWGKKRLGETSDFGGGQPESEPGFDNWTENETVYTAPTVDQNEFGGHDYDHGGYEQGIRDCKCGASMLSSSSSGPVNPFGACPMNPRKRRRVVYAFSARGYKIRVMDGEKKLREQSIWDGQGSSIVLIKNHVEHVCVQLAEEYRIDFDLGSSGNLQDDKLGTILQDQSILQEAPVIEW